MPICKRYKKTAHAHTGHKEAIFTRLRCKQWDCPECAKTNAWIWRQWLEKRLPEVSDEWWLLTLTANENTRSLRESMKNLRENLDRLFKRVKRVFGSISYVRVYEKHPTSQAIHVHVIISGISPFVANGCSVKLQPMAIGVLTRKGHRGFWSVKTWFKINARECTMGYIVDVKRIENGPISAMFYVTKYLTKAQQDIPIKGLRHVQTSTDIGSMPKKDDSLIWNTSAYITAQMFAPNTRIKDINTGETIDNDYWEVHGFYPYED